MKKIKSRWSLEFFAENLRTARGEASLTQSELSDRIGVSVTYIHMLEKGLRKEPKLSLLLKLCGALNCTPNDLLESK